MTGPRLLAALALAIGVMCAAIVALVAPWDVAAHAVVRWTARVSLVLFAAAYAARPLVQLRPTPLAKWLVRERKWLGLAFATSHAAHLAGIIAIASPDFGAFLRAQPPTNAIAAATFLLLFAMAFTSIDAVKARMSARRWKLLHRTGMHFAWISFAATYTGAVASSPVYAVPAAVILGVGALRGAAFLRARRRVAAARAAA
ncbi:MAG: ferric reductase-like transmembrane domain-containing protein [Deltaproteobacteria bacterium]|nr:ferric reductase-like transmembrane domain-containing protein [Deltaproteobacteria bacterium]